MIAQSVCKGTKTLPRPVPSVPQISTEIHLMVGVWLAPLGEGQRGWRHRIMTRWKTACLKGVTMAAIRSAPAGSIALGIQKMSSLHVPLTLLVDQRAVVCLIVCVQVVILLMVRGLVPLAEQTVLSAAASTSV
eukprot:Lithocolla_globosa_v1_NODE_503_length_3880_cov_6.757908.p3 type:complete len:133 gc:universal NODE_503_length_3880_cov_6.757908:1224-1622(+)